LGYEGFLSVSELVAPLRECERLGKQWIVCDLELDLDFAVVVEANVGVVDVVGQDDRDGQLLA